VAHIPSALQGIIWLTPLYFLPTHAGGSGT